MNRFIQPRFSHGCPRCVWLGQDGDFDCYYCPNGTDGKVSKVFGGTLLCRLSDDPGDYLSYDMMTAYRIITAPTGSNVRQGHSFETLLACLRAINESELVKTRHTPNWRKIKEHLPHGQRPPQAPV